MYAVIDVGSHSVRLMLTDGVFVEKRIITTRLAENLKVGGKIRPTNLERTAQAIAEFFYQAKLEGAKEIFVFATEAVRSAKNGKDLIARVWNLCGVTIEVLDKVEEAENGFLGAYHGGTCCTVDVGGASTEIAVGNEKGIIYSGNIPYGIVRLFNLENKRENLREFIPKILKQYGQIPPFDYVVGIGGTAGAIASIINKMEIYDPNVVNGYEIKADHLLKLYEKIQPLSVNQRKKITGLPINRADVITSGMLLLYKILQKLEQDKIIVSEGDNLEGFLIKKGILPKGFKAIYKIAEN